MSLSRVAWIWRSLFLVGWIVATWLFLTPIPPATPAGGIPFFDKIAHVGIFAVLATLARLGYPSRAPASAFVALVAYALLVETIQPYTGRAFELADLAAGAGGSLVAFLLPRRSAPS